MIDGNAIPATFYTTAATVGAALEEAETPIYLGDTVFPPLHDRVLPGQRIVIHRSLPVRVTVDGVTLSTRTRQQQVGDALAELGVFILGSDIVSPTLTTALQP